MDKEQAKFILQSFRPNGADAEDPHFAEALQLATQDRELGEWLAHERARDASFAEALEGLHIPDSLREEIFAVLHADEGAQLPEGEMDALFVGAMASVSPPEGLRDQILAAMEVQQKTQQLEVEPEKIAKFPMWRWMATAAAAAAVAVFSFIALEGGAGGPGEGGLAQATSQSYQQEMGKILNVSFELDKTDVTQNQAMEWVEEKQLPKPGVLPVHLSKVHFAGAKSVKLKSGLLATLLCYDCPKLGRVSLMVVDKESVKDLKKLPKLEDVTDRDCYHCPITKWSVVRWQDDANAYFVMTREAEDKLLEIF